MHDKPIVVFHDAYAYFSEALDVRVAGSIALGDAADAGARHMVELREEMEEQGVRCLFREPQHNPDQAEQLAADTGVRLGTLDPLGAKLEPGPAFYDRLLSAMVDEITTCLAAEG